MSEKLNMALVGVGRIGITHLNTMLQCEKVCLKAIVDPNEEVGRKYAEMYNVDYYKDVSELAGRDDIEAVNICVPEEYHMVTAIAAAKIGKHIMIEKPLAKTYEECQAMIKAAKENNVRLFCALTCHSMAQYRAVRQEYQRGKIGEFVEASIRRYGPRSIMEFLKGRVTIGFYIAVHDLDAIQWMTGHKITEVYAIRINKLNAYGEDGYDMAFKFDNGASGTMNINWVLNEGFPGSVCDVDIVGDKGILRMQPYTSGIQEYTDKQLYVSGTGYNIDGQMIGTFPMQMNHFADAVMNNKEFIVDAEEAAYSVKVVEAVLRSADSGKPELV
ncbi:MAG: Gfo/Idh/MocA family oxidoreductase [Flexilinea sp.]|nr:Gfo/Idh/MocA family oxidoreductase [Flexilinea sp.]